MNLSDKFKKPIIWKKGLADSETEAAAMTIKDTGLNVKQLEVNIGMEITVAKPVMHQDSTPQVLRNEKLIKNIMASLQTADEIR